MDSREKVDMTQTTSLSSKCWCTCHGMDGHTEETMCGTCWMFHGVTLRQWKNNLEKIVSTKRKKGKLVEIF